MRGSGPSSSFSGLFFFFFDLVAYQYHQEFREQEFNTWEALGTTRPSSGLYVDETPLVVVYRRR